MPHFDREGLRFGYCDLGDGQPVLFQHGLGCDLGQIEGLFPLPLAFRLLTMDFRGHGETRPLGPPEKLDFATFAADLVALLDHLGIRRAIVGGSSMGAAAALNLSLHFPDRVRGLILYRPCWIDQPLPANAQVFVSIARLLGKYRAIEGSQRFQQSAEYEDLLRQWPYVARSLVTLFADPRAEETAVKFERIARDAPCRSLEDLAAIRVPTLVLANRQDPIHPYAYGETLVRAIPGAMFHEVPPKSDGESLHATEVRKRVVEFVQSLGNDS